MTRRASSLLGLVCPRCGGRCFVVDSSSVAKGAAIRRRRQCTDCRERVTTFERIAESNDAPVTDMTNGEGANLT